MRWLAFSSSPYPNGAQFHSHAHHDDNRGYTLHDARGDAHAPSPVGDNTGPLPGILLRTRIRVEEMPQ